MKKIIHFSKFFIPTAILSCVFILSGVFAFFTKGINFGIDFQPGMIEEVKVAPTAIELTYNGAATISVELSAQGVDLVISGVGEENQTLSYPYIQYETIGAIATAMDSYEGITATLKADASTPAADFIANTANSSILSTTPYQLHYTPIDGKVISIDEVRELFTDLTNCSIKQSGVPEENTFQIRVGDDGSDKEISNNIQKNIVTKFISKFGTDSVAVLKTDFVGSQFSKSLAGKAILLVIATLMLIWIYATIRFHWDFALGAVLAVLHDALIMIAFVTWTQMEFTSTTLAAVLTIIGYSINDTVVVLDRVRENIKLVKVTKFTDILDISQSEVLSRTIITTITTMLAVFALFFFTTGSMKDFALALIVGMISGVYSTIFITGSFISLTRKHWKPSDEEKKTQVIDASDQFAE